MKNRFSLFMYTAMLPLACGYAAQGKKERPATKGEFSEKALVSDKEVTSSPLVGSAGFIWDPTSSQNPQNGKKNNKKQSKNNGESNPFLPQRLTMRVIQGKGIGYDSGYSTFEALFSQFYNGKGFLPMVDTRVHHIDKHNEYAFNLGFIGRYLWQPQDIMVGGNIYYDFREGQIEDYNQIGFGFEVLGKYWDFHINAAGNIGDGDFWGTNRGKLRCCFDCYRGGFFANYTATEYALNNANAELGFYLARMEYFQLYLSGGPYYLWGQKHDDNIWGGQVRLRPQIQDFLAFDFIYSNDSLFGSIFQGQIVLSLPLDKIFYKKNKRQDNCVSDWWVYQPVQRFEIIPLDLHSGWKTNFCNAPTAAPCPPHCCNNCNDGFNNCCN